MRWRELRRGRRGEALLIDFERKKRRIYRKESWENLENLAILHKSFDSYLNIIFIAIVFLKYWLWVEWASGIIACLTSYKKNLVKWEIWRFMEDIGMRPGYRHRSVNLSIAAHDFDNYFWKEEHQRARHAVSSIATLSRKYCQAAHPRVTVKFGRFIVQFGRQATLT